MTIHERIKYFRKEILKISQRDFANKIGLKQNTICYIEKGTISVTEQVLKTICLAFDLNEDWLRHGTEPMYTQPQTFRLDEFIKEHGASELEYDILKVYFSIDPTIRKHLLEYFVENFNKSADKKITLPRSASAFREKDTPVGDENTVG